MEFIISGDVLNKGTLQTLEHLIDAKDDIEIQSAIWIYAYTKDLLNNLPYEWRGDSARLLHAVNNCSFFYLKNKDIYWHYAMKSLLPNSCISGVLLADIKPTNEYTILELVAINSNYIMSNYTVVKYDSRDK